MGYSVLYTGGAPVHVSLLSEDLQDERELQEAHEGAQGAGRRPGGPAARGPGRSQPLLNAS